MVLRKGWLRHLDFIMVDMASLEIALAMAFWIVSKVKGSFIYMFWQLFLLLPLISVIAGIMMDSHNGILQRGYLMEVGTGIRQDVAVLSVVVWLCYFLKLMPGLPPLLLGLYFVIHLPLCFAMRFAHKFFLRWHYSNVKYARQIVVATTENAAKSMIETITESAVRNYRFFGLAVLDKSMIGEKIEHVTVSADRDTMIDFVKSQVVDEVFINLPDDSAQTLALTRKLLDMGLTVHIFMGNSYQQLPNRVIGNVFGYHVLTTTISPATFRQSFAKRCMDIAGGLVGCMLTLLLTIVIGPIIFIKSPGPIFFSQTRVGKKGREFKIYKFRSMYMDAEERKQELMAQNKIHNGMMFKMDDDPRIIKGIGQFIRKTSIDEFPQFWNVLKGDMSMVGTRPPTVDEYRRYSPYHKRRLSMLPGITGLWQTSGRSNITDFEQVVKLDTEYIEHWSLKLDIKILLKTIQRIFKDEDAM